MGFFNWFRRSSAPPPSEPRQAPPGAVFVMTLDGRMYADSSGRMTDVALAGGAARVVGAGRIVADNGRVLEITNESRTYHPTLDQMRELVARLSATGLDLSGDGRGTVVTIYKNIDENSIGSGPTRYRVVQSSTGIDLVEESTASSPAEAYRGCRLFVSASGLAGVAIGVEGERAGYLYNLFVSPREDQLCIPSLMGLALQAGAQRVVAYEHPFLARFFAQYGFQPDSSTPLAEMKDAPSDWMPTGYGTNGYPNVTFMSLRDPAAAERTAQAVRSKAQAMQRRNETRSAGEEGCVACGGPVSFSGDLWGTAGVYECQGCAFVYACGTLALGPRER